MMRFAMLMGAFASCLCEDDALFLLQKSAQVIEGQPPEEHASKMRKYFVVGHHNGCPENYRSVRNEGQCMLALSALGLKEFEETGAWADMPGGCYKRKDGHVFLNTGKGAGTKGAEPICEWKWGNYFKLGQHNGCPENYGNVHDPDNCEKAVKALSLKSFAKSEKFSDKPSGCFVDPSGHVFLNEGKGVKAEGHSPICEWKWSVASADELDAADEDTDKEESEEQERDQHPNVAARVERRAQRHQVQAGNLQDDEEQAPEEQLYAEDIRELHAEQEREEKARKLVQSWLPELAHISQS